MSPDEVLRHLRRIRFCPRAGRPVSLSWIARQAGTTSPVASCTPSPMAASPASWPSA